MTTQQVETIDTYRHDLEEAMLAMASSQTMRDAGLDERFAQTYAKHAHRLALLPESAQRKIGEQFSRMATELSYSDAVGRIHPETMQRRLAAWFKAVLLLLILQSKGLA